MEDRAIGLEEQLSSFQDFAAFAVEAGVRGIRDLTARIVGDKDGGSGAVVLAFSHDDFPGVSFDYRCKLPGEDRHEQLWLAEELATGALHRVMRYDHPAHDERGVVSTRLYGQLLGSTDGSTRPALVLRACARVEATDVGATCGIFVSGTTAYRACRGAAVARVSTAAFDRAVVDHLGRAVGRAVGRDDALYVGACEVHVDELRRRAERRGTGAQLLGIAVD